MRRRLEYGGGMNPQLAQLMARANLRPEENLVESLGDLAAQYINKQTEDEKNRKRSEGENQALGLLLGSPGYTETTADGDTINWNEAKPNLAAAMAALPQDSELGNKLIETEINRRQLDDDHKFRTEMDERNFGQQKELAGYQHDLAMQLARENARLRAPEDVKTIETAEGIFVLKPDGTLGNRLGSPKPRGGQGITVDEDGNISVTSPEKALTQDQANATTFYNRMQEAEKIIEDQQKTGLNAWQEARDNVPLIGNWLTSDDKKQLEQAKRNWVTANLRKESGATISKEEFETADKQYFPQPGDDDTTLKNKRQARIAAQLGLKVAAGPGIERIEREKKKFAEQDQVTKQDAERKRLEELRAKKAGGGQ